jgi:alkylhydroperoxidase family enzyme
MPQRRRESDYLSLMARLDVPDGPGGEAAMLWTLRPELGCVACSDFRAPSVLDAGIAPELYENVAAYATYPGYTPRQRLAIEYAERFATDHASIDDDFFGRLREVFSDEEILDLTLCVAVFLGLGRSLAVLGVDQSCAMDV